MSKCNVRDKVVIEITNRFKNAYGHEYCSILDSVYSTEFIDEKSEPLRNYTEPLEAKIRRQAAEITRLLRENKKLKEQMKFDIPTLISEEDRRRMEINKARAEGAEAAWELARKIVLYGEDVYSGKELKEIFDCTHTQEIIRNHTYPEAATKVAEWKKAKEEIKIGDILEDTYDSNVKCVVTNLYPSNRAYLVFDDGTAGMHELDNFKKTERHINIDGFLKQIGR